MIRLSISVLLAAALLSGCSSEPTRSVEWYRDHPEERRAKLKECSEQPKLQSDADGNCARAQKAEPFDRPSGPQQLGSVVDRKQ